MTIDASLQRKVDGLKAEAEKLRQSHKIAQTAANDKLQRDVENLNAKRQQMLDAEKKRNATKQNTKEMVDYTSHVEFMLQLKEKYASGGFDYENEINDKLKKHGKTDPNAKTAGSSGDAPDAKFNHNGEEHNLEVKKDKNAMYGQIELKHDGKKWAISDKSRAKYPETAKSIEATGFLHKVNKQWGKPTGDYEKDLQLGNVYHTHPDTEPIKAHYGKDRKTNYIQVGGGHGFYHTGTDKAKLGSPELDGKTQLRARMKARGRDAEGKRTYGALIVMGLKEPTKSHHNLDVDVQKEWIEDILMGHKEFKLNEATESPFSIGFRNGQEERIKQNPYTDDMDEYTEYENGFYQGVMQRRVMQESDASFAAGKEKEKEKRLTSKDQNTLAKLRAMMAKEKKPVKEEIEQIDELKNSTLDAYKVKANASADKLTAQGKHGEALKRRGNVMKATGKQIDKTSANIGRALRGEPVKEAVKSEREDDEYHNEPKPAFKAKSTMDRPHTVHIDGKPWKKFDNGHQAHAAAKTLQAKGKKATAIAHFKEEVAANNVGGGGIAGTQGDAGKKVVMTKEPLKRKPIPKFKNFVAQDHENA